DRTTGPGLDGSGLVAGTTDFDLSNSAAGARDGDRADRRLYLADGLGKRSCNHLSAAAKAAGITRRIACGTEHAGPSLCLGCLAAFCVPFLAFVGHELLRLFRGDPARAHFIPVECATIEISARYSVTL